jgi:hypothetical protein
MSFTHGSGKVVGKCTAPVATPNNMEVYTPSQKVIFGSICIFTPCSVGTCCNPEGKATRKWQAALQGMWQGRAVEVQEQTSRLLVGDFDVGRHDEEEVSRGYMMRGHGERPRENVRRSQGERHDSRADR